MYYLFNYVYRFTRFILLSALFICIRVASLSNTRATQSSATIERTRRLVFCRLLLYMLSSFWCKHFISRRLLYKHYIVFWQHLGPELFLNDLWFLFVFSVIKCWWRHFVAFQKHWCHICLHCVCYQHLMHSLLLYYMFMICKRLYFLLISCFCVVRI